VPIVSKSKHLFLTKPASSKGVFYFGESRIDFVFPAKLRFENRAIKKNAQVNLAFFLIALFIRGESRIRTCEVYTADLQSALVGSLSISPTP
jgi:hypothetical protein